VPVFLTGWVFGEATFGSLLAEVVRSDGVFGRLKGCAQNVGLTAENSFAGRGEKGF
jgi:hypothetical protein